VAGAALGIMTTLVAVVYALSELLQNEKMKSWAKTEFAEIFYSAIIISMFILGVPLLDQLVKVSLVGANQVGGSLGCKGTVTSVYMPLTEIGTFTNTKTYTCVEICNDAISSSPDSVYSGVDACHMRLGIWFMHSLFDEGKQFAFDTYLSYIKSSMIGEFTINIEFMFEKAGFFTFNPWRGFYTIPNKVKELIFDWVIKIMMVLKFQEVLLRFIAVALFPALLVIGGVLRTFAFTRRLGGLLLAIALSLYFIFPAFYASGALIMLNIKNNPVVMDEWLTNTTVNPRGASNPDPPVVNTMYITGQLPMPGGGKTSYDYQEVQDKLWDMEGKSHDEIMKINEGRPCDSGDPSGVPCFDMSPQDTSSISDTQMKENQKSSFLSALSWVETISNETKFDQFIGFAWSKGGPVDVAANFTFWAGTFSIFGLLASIAAIRSLAVTFGGDIEIAGLTRLI
jgi:hypothetical protein